MRKEQEGVVTEINKLHKKLQTSRFLNHPAQGDESSHGRRAAMKEKREEDEETNHG